MSMNEEEILDKNLNAALNPLTEHEAYVMASIQHKFFAPVRLKHWEGVEVSNYQEEMNK